MKISLNAATAPLSRVEYANHRILIRSPEAKCSPMPAALKRLRKWQRWFLEWYSANEGRFAIKLEPIKHTDRQLDVGFCGISRIITACVTCDEITVAVEWHGCCWDFLQDFETYPQRVPDGFVCRQCPEDSRPVYPSREALQRAEVFEPLEAVSISGTADDASWARLVGRTDAKREVGTVSLPAGAGGTWGVRQRLRETGA
jgi:hypothetical protein